MKENRIDIQNRLSSLTQKGIGQKFHSSGISSWWQEKYNAYTDENLVNSIPVLFNNEPISEDKSDSLNFSQDNKPLFHSLSALNDSIMALSGKINRKFSSGNNSQNSVSNLNNINQGGHESTNSMVEDNSSIAQAIMNITSTKNQDQTSNSFSGVSKWFRKDSLSQYNLQYLVNTNSSFREENESGYDNENEKQKRLYNFPVNETPYSSESTEENNLLQKYWQTTIQASNGNKEKLLDSDLLRRITSIGNNQENLKPTQHITQNFGDIIIQPASVEISMQQLKGKLQDVLKQVKDSIY